MTGPDEKRFQVPPQGRHQGEAGPPELTIPFERILWGMRAGNVPAIADALVSRDPARLADTLRACNPTQILEALRQGNRNTIVEAFLQPDPTKQHLAQQGRRVARALVALQSRNPVKIASALRHTEVPGVLEGLRSLHPDRLLHCLSQTRPDSRKTPLDSEEAQTILAHLPDADVWAPLCEAIQTLAPASIPPPLSETQAMEILAALQDQDAEQIRQALLQRYRAIWTGVLLAVLPKVTAAAQQKLKVFGTSNPEQAAESVVQSVARSFLSGLHKGTYQDYELESLTDLANVMVQIGWRKCCKRLEQKPHGQPVFFPESSEDSYASFDWPDPEADQVRELIRAEMHQQVAEVLEEFAASLDCVDRVILQSKLAEGTKSTRQEIANRVIEECGYNRCSLKMIDRHWKDIQQRLRDRLSDTGDFVS